MTSGMLPLDGERERRPKLEPSRELARYLSRVISDTERLTFGNPPGANAEKLRLKDVWIPPTVTVVDFGDSLRYASPQERRRLAERTEMQVDAALNMPAFRRAVVTAPPGYGKSTLCRRLAHLHAYQASVQGSGWVPVRIPLATVNESGNWSSIEELLRQLPEVDNPGLVDVLSAAAVQGHLWFFLDGLDEVDASQLSRLRSQLDSTVLASRNRVLVTCRTSDYAAERPNRSLGPFPVLEMSGFTDDELETYIEQWHGSVSGDRSGVTRQRVAATLDRLDSYGELRELARSPLLAAVMCVVETQPLKTQPGKAALLKRAVEYLLIDPRWRDFGDRYREWGVDSDLARRLACRLAFGMFDNPDGRSRAAISLDDLRDYVRDVIQEEGEVANHQDLDSLINACVEQLVGRNAAGLLQQTDANLYTFAHRSLQEYLAAQHLITYVDRAYRAELALQPKWREVFGYVASIAQTTGDGLTDLLLLARTLLRRTESAIAAASDPARLTLIAEGACLSGEVLAEVGPQALRRFGFGAVYDQHSSADQEDPGFNGLQSLAIDVLSAVVGRTTLPKTTRIRALSAVSSLGDPRFADTAGRLVPGRLAFVDVPGGHGRVGTAQPLRTLGKKKISSSPRLEVDVPPVRMARFPVMNMEFAEFIADGGYQDDAWWATKEARLWLAQDPTFVDELVRLWESQKDLHFEKELGEREFAKYATDQSKRIATRIMQRSQPLYWRDSRFNLPTAPVVGVNHWEAEAYCRWLDNRLRTLGLIGDDEIVALPTEVEWEWAASGQATGPVREYPWGAAFDPAQCITRDFVSSASDPPITYFGAVPVGLQTFGQAGIALEDLGGNVWEWVSSVSMPWDADGDREAAGGLSNRICRGGSWYSREPMATHVSFRSDDPPCNAYWDLGFRVVVRPTA